MQINGDSMNDISTGSACREEDNIFFNKIKNTVTTIQEAIQNV